MRKPKLIVAGVLGVLCVPCLNVKALNTTTKPSVTSLHREMRADAEKIGRTSSFLQAIRWRDAAPDSAAAMPPPTTLRPNLSHTD